MPTSATETYRDIHFTYESENRRYSVRGRVLRGAPCWIHVHEDDIGAYPQLPMQIAINPLNLIEKFDASTRRFFFLHRGTVTRFPSNEAAAH